MKLLLKKQKYKRRRTKPQLDSRLLKRGSRLENSRRKKRNAKSRL